MDASTLHRGLAAGVVALGAALAGCAVAPVVGGPPPPDGLFDDSRFAAPSQPVDGAAAFAATPAMQRFLREDIAPQLRRRGPTWGLVEALRDVGQLKLEYDAERTRTAAEAFDARAGNCLALVLMTSALAQELGLTVRYQVALVPDSWSRSGDLTLRSGHVNLTLSPGPKQRVYGALDDGGVTVDFVPPEQAARLRTRSIEQPTVLAMFMNNRAVETLAQGQLDDAYAWARAALRQDASYLPTYNTLGVVYLRHGDLALAERALRHALARDANDTLALGTLVSVLQRADRADEAQVLQARLDRLEPRRPFADFDAGREALARGDAEAARDLFRKELDRDRYQHAVHYWLAVALHRLGDDAQAREHLTLAAKYGASRSVRDLYAAKLSTLQALP